LALGFLAGVWFPLASDYTLSLFCPADTLVAGSVGGGPLLTGGASFLAMSGCFALISFFLPAAKRPRRADLVLARRRRIASIAGVCLLLLAIPLMVDGLASFYCLRPLGILVSDTPFGAGRVYAWTDVGKITAACSSARWHSNRFYVDVVMKDGRMISVQDDALIRNYREISDALSDVPFAYDNARTENCQPKLRQLFATRPGARTELLPRQTQGAAAVAR
jgi:hypothetical protein